MNWLKEKLLASVKSRNQTQKASIDLSKLKTKIERLEKEVEQLRLANSACASSIKTLSVLMDSLAQNQKSIASQVQHIMEGLEILLSSYYEVAPNTENNNDEWN
jgi:outer membrane murein-binding lipoprotein Lpp